MINIVRSSKNRLVNPLYKVAALDIRRDNELNKQKRELDLNVTLNFKRSEMMTGHAISKSGDPVTINFAMEVRRASLDLFVAPSVVGNDCKFSISKVAFVSSLSVPHTVKETLGTQGMNRHEVQTGIAGSIALESTGGVGKVYAQGSGTAARSAQSAESYQRTINYSTISVNGTHAGNHMHWEISPSMRRTSIGTRLSDPTYLIGEVFQCSETSRPIHACHISWSDRDVTPSIEAVGKVFVYMKDLNISNVKFSDENGEELAKTCERNVRAHEDADSKKLLEASAKFRQRIVKEVIRKALVDIGLHQKGSAIQICEAAG